MDSNVGKKIKQFRNRAGISQMDLELEIGASPGSISRIESGKVNPTKETLIKIIDVLQLKAFEISSFFNTKSFDFTNLIQTSEKFNRLNLCTVLQNSANEISRVLNLLGISISLVKGERIYGATFTQSWFTETLTKLFPIPFNQMNISLSKHKDNLLVKTVNEKRIFHLTDARQVTKHIFSDRLANLISKIMNFKSGITVPLMFNDRALGTIIYSKTYYDDFSNELSLIKAYTNHLALAIENAKKYEELKEKINN